MATAIKKRTRLSGMKYNRVDLVPDGANQMADIVFHKSKNGSETVRKTAGSVTCNNCGTKMGTQFTKCKKCNSSNLKKTIVEVIKTVGPVKKEPKNDSSNKPNNSTTFEDSVLDTDDSDNGAYVDAGDSEDDADGDEENSDSMSNKPVKDIKIKLKKDGVADVVNTTHEKELEGEDDDSDIEDLAEKTQAESTPRTGFKSTSTATSDSTMMVNKKNGKGSSQVAAESAQQMYEDNSEEDDADDSQDSTRSKVVNKKKRTVITTAPKNPLDTGNDGIYANEGKDSKIKNGKNNGSARGTTNGSRGSVAPPGNKLDKIRKSRSHATVEALNLSVGFAENLSKIIKSGKWSSYTPMMEDFVATINACASSWNANTSVTKSNTYDSQVEEIEERINNILKASLAQNLSDEASQGRDPDDVEDEDISNKPKNVDAGDVTGMVNKAADEEDIYKGLHPALVAKMKAADDIIEKNTVSEWEEVAKQYRSIPGTDVASLAKTLRFLGENNADGYEAMIKTLNAAAANLSDSTVFKQMGRPGGGTLASANPMDAAFAYADDHISKGAEGKTKEALVAEYMQTHGAEFYQNAPNAVAVG